MTAIQISQLSAEPDGSFVVRVSFGDEAGYETRVSDPATEGIERLLAWYFEEHLRFPFLDKELEQQAVVQLAGYGRSLFDQVFSGAASHDYRRLWAQAFDGCRLEVRGSAAFHVLHWETLWDPQMNAPLAVRLPVTRQVEGLASKFELPPERSSLNILLVTARPFGRGDVGYRTISRPLLGAIRHSGLPVTIDMLRPGTWQALREHLQTLTERQGSGWYQVIHFDLHGGFTGFAELAQQQEKGKYPFGAAPVQPFEGKRPFLFFETAAEGKAAPIPAAEVASLLAEHRIPVAVLNACQSVMQSGSEASLAQCLVEAGVPVAIGMAYSVTVSAAALAMPVLYERLTQGADLGSALHAMRRTLFESTGRQAYYDEQLDLQDWMLPVGFRRQPVQLRLRPKDDAEQAAFFQRQADVGDEPEPEYGFVGRDMDVQAIERRLLTSPDNNELLIQGMAGAGKSTLLRHLAWWWQRTSLAQQVFTFSYEDRAWTAAQIIREIRGRLLSPAEAARADTMPAPAQREQVVQMLRATRHLLILDNAESITATPAAIPHALDLAEQVQLKMLLARLRGGQTLVLVGSRETEAWLASSSFGANIYPLPCLDPQAASALLDRILQRHNATRWLDNDAERQALDDLVNLLGGYPLPMTVVLPVLAITAPSQILAELKAGGSAADPTETITRAIEYSHGKLDPALQEALLLLAPFTAVIPFGPALDEYRNILLRDSSVDITSADLADAVNEAARVGLASPHPQLEGWVQVLPVLPYFLRSRLRRNSQLQAATTQAHYQLYTTLGSQLHQLLITPGDPQARALGQAATRAEYANLTAALAHGLATSQLISALILPLEEYLDQTQQQTARRQLLEDAIAGYPRPASEAQRFELAQLHNLAGNAAITQYRLDDAKAHHETELELLKANADKKSQAITYHQLGRVAQEQDRLAEAEDAYRQALDIKLEYGDRHSAASTYQQLGALAQEQRRFAEAEAAYRQALDIWLEYGDRHSAALTYHQLGTLAQEQDRPAEAETAYRQALDVKLEYGDRHSAASTYQQLGILAQEQRRFPEAEAAYRQALDIWLGYGDWHSTALTYLRLGTLAQEQRRFAEAETAYRQALDIWLEYGDRHSAALTYHQLGTLAQEQDRPAEAETAYRQALDVFRQSDKRLASQTETRIGQVLAALGRHGEAAKILLAAAVGWYELTGKWDSIDLQWLKRERREVGELEFGPLIRANVPESFQSALIEAIDNADTI